MKKQNRYFALYKPYDMVSQFISPENVRLLSDLNFDFPAGTHAIGRLDSKSEGLLLLTTDKSITRLLFSGKKPHKRSYLVRVSRHVTAETARNMSEGIEIVVDGGAQYKTQPCSVNILKAAPPFLESYQLEDRPNVPHTWLNITLTEGKYHQVRKMVRTMRHPCRRLIRESIEDISIRGMHPGDIKELGENDFYSMLHLAE